jgi:hypothetical protein
MKICRQHASLSSPRPHAFLATASQGVCVAVLGTIFGVCATSSASADLIHAKAVTTFQSLSGVSVPGQSMDLTWEPLNWDSSFTTRDFLRSPSNLLSEPGPKPAIEFTLLSDNPAIAFRRD